MLSFRQARDVCKYPLLAQVIFIQRVQYKSQQTGLLSLTR